MQVLGDATVRRFLVRDTDAWLLPCGRAAVTQWEESEAMFHVMRDHPAHYGQMLAGLWGGHNYHNLSLAAQEEVVWPMAQHSALIHDSYRCLASHQARYGQVVPFPTRRAGGAWTGSGPARKRCCGRWRLGRVLGSASAAQGRVDQLLIQWIFKMLLCL